MDRITSVPSAYHELQYFAGVMLIVSSSVSIRTFCQDRSRYVTPCHAITFLTLLTNGQKKLVLKSKYKFKTLVSNARKAKKTYKDTSYEYKHLSLLESQIACECWWRLYLQHRKTNRNEKVSNKMP